MSQLVRTILGLALVVRLPRPWRRRRPTSGPAPVRPEGMAGNAPSAALEHLVEPYGRRCALANPTGTPVHRAVGRYQDAHVGKVDRGMVAFPRGMHRAPEDTLRIDFVGDDSTTQTIVLPRDTVAWPRTLLTVLAPLPSPAGAR